MIRPSAVVAILLLFSAEIAAASPIQWRLLTPFRLFDQSDEASRRAEALMELFRGVAPEPAGERLRTLHEGLTLHLGGVNADALRSSHWNAATRSYSTSYLYPTQYRIQAQLPSAPVGALCRWRVREDNGELRYSDGSCSGQQLAIHGGFGPSGRWRGYGHVAVEVVGTGLRHERVVEIEDMLVVAMGDSFISGEGNPDVPTDWSAVQPGPRFTNPAWPDRVGGLAVGHARWWDEPCHRSLLSWPVIASLHAASRNTQRAVTLVHLGCSGAEIDDGLLTPQVRERLPGCPNLLDRRNCPPNGDEVRSQLEVLRAMLGETPRPVDRLFLSIGGNDIGFAGMIAYLAVPPNGYLAGPLVPRFLLGPVGPVCPLEDRPGRPNEATVLRRLCGYGPSAEERLRSLPAAFLRLGHELRRIGVRPQDVYHTAYPNILQDAPGHNDRPNYCHHALAAQDLRRLERAPERHEAERAYARAYPYRVRPAGFEAMQAVLPGIARLRTRWNFQFHHNAGQQCSWPEISSESTEVCKADWAWRELNRAIVAPVSLVGGRSVPAPQEELINRIVREPTEHFVGPYGWNVVVRHVGQSRGHGWCRSTADDPLELPVASRTGGEWRWVGSVHRQTAPGPAEFQAQRADRQRWFRTTNDSVLTQYGGEDRFHHGTIHPTLHAHIAVAQAVSDAAFATPAD